MLGDNIKAFRKQKGMTQEELAERLHVVRQTVSKWEKNLSVPDAAALQELADALDVTVTQLLGGEPEPETATEPTRNDIAIQLARYTGSQKSSGRGDLEGGQNGPAGTYGTGHFDVCP